MRPEPDFRARFERGEANSPGQFECKLYAAVRAANGRSGRQSAPFDSRAVASLSNIKDRMLFCDCCTSLRSKLFVAPYR